MIFSNTLLNSKFSNIYLKLENDNILKYIQKIKKLTMFLNIQAT